MNGFPIVVIGALLAPVFLTACTSTPPPSVRDSRCVDTSPGDIDTLAPQVRTYRGGGAAINRTVTLDTNGRYRLVAATITGPTKNGQHPSSHPFQAVWLLGGRDVTEVSPEWGGQLLGTDTGQWPSGVAQELRQKAIDCLLRRP